MGDPQSVSGQGFLSCMTNPGFQEGRTHDRLECTGVSGAELYIGMVGELRRTQESTAGN